MTAQPPPAIATGPVWGLSVPLPVSSALPRRAAVVIVGAGITGVALLGWLRERDVDAVVVERHHVAAGASGRNAGFLLAGVVENYARAVARYGRAVAAEVWAFTLENHALVAARAEPLDADYRRGGSWTVALDAAEAAALEESATLLVEDRLPGRLAGERPGGALTVLENPADGEVDPVRLVRGMALPLAPRIFEGRDVLAVNDGNNYATVHLADGATIEASAVVLATNAWTAQLWPGAPIRPVRAQMLATAPTAVPFPAPVYAEWGHRYWRRRADGALLVGGFRSRAAADEEGFDAGPTAAIQAHLDTQVAALGVDAPVTHRWAGTMGFSTDGLPLAGRVPGSQRLFVAAGYTGHGMGFAVNTTRVLTEHILESTALPPWLDAARTAPLPLG
jgi:glycine/D-amino acid oxidase-like deaminating enzyme